MPSLVDFFHSFLSAIIILYCSFQTANAVEYTIGHSGWQETCSFSNDITVVTATILCSVEKKFWFIDQTYISVMESEGLCLLGGERCKKKMTIPQHANIPASPPPPPAKNKQYQALAITAEKLVPDIWWRRGFSNDLLLLSHNDTDFPLKFLSTKLIRNKKLKNIHQCASRQSFIRKSYTIDSASEQSEKEKIGPLNAKCDVDNSSIVKEFWKLWRAHKYFGGEFGGDKLWRTDKKSGEKIRLSALSVLDLILQDFGGIWTGCYKLIRSPDCRVLLAAASFILSVHNLADIANPKLRRKTEDKRLSVESDIVIGYMLASLGRALLHGEKSSTGEKAVSVYGIACADFVGIQAAYLQLYIESIGALYTKQLTANIPMAFPPSFPVYSKSEWKPYASQLEPVYTTLRNWMFSESSNLIDFGPYRPLVAFPAARAIVTNKNRRVLIDVGANGFFASPKYLLDSYAPFVPFTHAIMIEPEPHFSATVPDAYLTRYNISFMQIYAEVNTGSSTDVVKMLPTLVSKDDFVVLKFDVDPNRYAQGPTMEWGFLFSLMQSPEAAAVVDELYIELHFNFPSLYWYHYHSNWEALDCIRYLRANGVVVHSWP